MILYFADRGFNIIGIAGDKIKRGYNLENDTMEIDVESGVATLSFDIFYNDTSRSFVEKLTSAGNYILYHSDGINEDKTYTIIDTEQNTENRSINIYAEDVGLDLINDISMIFNAETADFDTATDHAEEGNAANKGYIDTSGVYHADNNYRATNYMGLGNTPPEAYLFSVSKSVTGSRRYSVAFYNSSKAFIANSGTYFYATDSNQTSRVVVPLNAKYVRISFHVDYDSVFFVPSSVKSYTIAEYAATAITNSGFEIGLNEFGNTKLAIEFGEVQTASERIKDIATTFGAEIRYSYTFSGLRVTHKYVNFHKRIGAYNDVELRMGREVKNIRVKRSVAELATAILALGITSDDEGNEVYVTLDGYSGDIESGYYIDGNKLCSSKAYSKWSRYLSASNQRSGHIVKKFEYECSIQKALYENALTDLKAIEDASVEYEVELYSLPNSVNLGDTVNIVDDVGEIYISARVLSIKRSEINDTIEVTLGEFKAKSSGLVDEWALFKQRFANWTSANAPKYIWVAYADDNQGTGISLVPTGKTWMGLADNQKTEIVDLSDPSIFNWIQLTAKDGKDGKDGTGIKSTTVSYAVSNSPSVMPGANDWQSTLPTVDEGKVLWTRTITDYTDASIADTVTYTYAYQGSDGTNGHDGLSMSVKSIQYQAGASPTNYPTTPNWTNDVPNVPEGWYLWTRTIFTDGATDSPVYGVSKIGKDGKDADPLTVMSATKSGDTTTIILSDGTSFDVKDGSDGTPGTNGQDGKSSYIHVKYSNDGGAHFTGNGGEDVGSWIGTYTDENAADSASVSAYKWIKMEGVDGEDGKDGFSPTATVTKSGNTTTITITDKNGTTTKTVTDGTNGSPGAPGADGKTAYFHVKYSNDGGQHFTGNSGEDVGSWIGTYTDNTQADSTSVSAYTWVKIEGYDGVDGSQIWTTTVAPATPNYTFTISNLHGDGNAEIKVGDIILYSYYRYTVTSISSTTVLAGTRQNLRGEAGAAGTVYELLFDKASIVKDKSGNYNPTSITISSKSHAGTAAPAAYAGRYIIETSVNGSSWTSRYTSSANESTYTYTIPTGIMFVRVSLYLAGGTATLLDQQTIPVISDGVDGLSPSINVAKNGTTTTITVVNVDGTSSTQDILDGTNGTSPTITTTKSGNVTIIKSNGSEIGRVTDGTDGHSPVITAEKSGSTTTIKADGTAIGTIADGNSVTIKSATKTGDTTTVVLEDSSGTKQLTIKDGMNGGKGDKGDPGSNAYIHIAWANSADGSSGFSTTVSAGKLYLGSYSDNTEADSTDYRKYSWSLIKGADGVSIGSVEEHYLIYANSTGVTTSTSGWTTDIQTMTEAKPYLWNYKVFKSTTGAMISTTSPVVIGRYGADGTNGTNGRSITSIQDHYQISNSNTTPPTTWSNTPMNTTPTNKYLWNYATITYTNSDGTTSTEDTAKRVIGTQSKEIVSKVDYYAISSSNTAPTDGNRYVIDQTSGNPAIAEKAVGRNAEEVVLTFGPKQDTSGGDPSPTNVCPITGWNDIDIIRTGKNLFAGFVPATKTVKGITYEYIAEGEGNTWRIKITGTSTGSNADSGNKDIGGADARPIIMKANTKYTVSITDVTTTPKIRLYLRNSAGSNLLYKDSTTGVWVFTPTTDIKVYKLMLRTITSGSVMDIDGYFQIEQGPAATEYEPYDEASYDISFEDAGTVYGGTLNVTTGELTVTKGVKVYDGTETWSTEYTYNFYTNTGRGSGVQDTNYECSHFRYASILANSTDVSKMPSAYISTTGDFNIQRADIEHTPNAMKQWCLEQYQNDTPLTVVFTLKTPIVYNLTPTEVKLLTGTNVLTSDADVIDASYWSENDVEWSLTAENTNKFSEYLWWYYKETYSDGSTYESVPVIINSIDSRISEIETKSETYFKKTDDAIQMSADLTNTLTQKEEKLNGEIEKTNQLIGSLSADLLIEAGKISQLTSDFNNLTNDTKWAKTYLQADGFHIQDSENLSTETTLTGDGMNIKNNTTQETLLKVTSTNTEITNTTINGYANVAGATLQSATELEYDLVTQTVGFAIFV